MHKIQFGLPFVFLLLTALSTTLAIGRMYGLGPAAMAIGTWFPSVWISATSHKHGAERGAVLITVALVAVLLIVLWGAELITSSS